MKLSTVFTVNSVLSLLFGLGFLLVPAMQLTSFGAESSAAAELIARTYGGGLLGLALMSWLARNAGISDARSAIVWGFIESLEKIVMQGPTVDAFLQINN